MGGTSAAAALRAEDAVRWRGAARHIRTLKWIVVGGVLVAVLLSAAFSYDCFSESCNDDVGTTWFTALLLVAFGTMARQPQFAILCIAAAGAAEWTFDPVEESRLVWLLLIAGSAFVIVRLRSLRAFQRSLFPPLPAGANLFPVDTDTARDLRRDPWNRRRYLPGGDAEAR